MGFLAGKRLLITGFFRIARLPTASRRHASAKGPSLHLPMSASAFASALARWRRSSALICVYDMDVGDDAQIAAAFDALKQRWDGLDGLVHSIGFAPREAIAGDFVEGLSRESFRIAHDISSYSFPALAKAALPLMEGRKASLLTLTYLGSTRAVPNYNTMGLAKASLEASVRYLAASLGPRGIRVNGISAGPIRTLAAAGIKGFSKILSTVESTAPLRRNVTIEDVGNVAAFLLSDLAAGITAEITHVDGGFNAMMGLPLETE